MGGITVAGKIEAGTIQIGDDVLVIPGGEYGVIKGIIYFLKKIKMEIIEY